MTRPPLWTEEEAREDAEREGEADESQVAGCLFDAGGCILEGLFAFLPLVLLVVFLG